MSDFYYEYESPPRNNTMIFIIVAIVLTILAVVIYLKYDDIMSMFESNDETSKSSSSKKVVYDSNEVDDDEPLDEDDSNEVDDDEPSDEDDSNEVDDEPSNENGSREVETDSSESATSNEATTSSPVTTSKAASTIQWNKGTRDIGETCEKNEDCRSSDPFPLVCSEDESTQVKTCKKPNKSEDIIRASNCYVYQCNKHMNKSIDKTFTWFDDKRPVNYQEPCYNCEIRQWWYEGGHAKKYRLRPVAFLQMPTFADYPTIVDKEALYNKVCHKTGNTCEPAYQANK